MRRIPGIDDGELQVTVHSAPRLHLDPELQRSSQSMHHFLVGQLAYGQEDFPRAVENFSRASELIGDPVPILNARLAELYVKAGNLEQALEQSRRALEPDPDNMSNLLLYAGILEALNRPAEAEPIFQRVISAHPDSFDAYVLLGSLYARQSRIPEGLKVLDELVRRAPEEAVGYYYRGRVYEVAEDFAKADRDYTRAWALNNENVSIAVDLVRVALKSKQYDRAREISTRILAQDPGNVPARRVMGQLLIGENKLDEALEHLQVLESVEQDPSETRFKIALIQIERNNFPEAIRELNLVLAQSPKHASARYYLASMYAGSGRRREAIEELGRIERGSDMYVKARMFAAFILRQDGQLEEAEAAAREALDADEGNKPALTYLVLILRETGKFEEARRILAQAIEREPGNDRLLFNYGIVLDDLDRPEESIRIMEQVIELNPRHGDALNFLAYHLAEKRLTLDRALELSRRALEVAPSDGYYLDTLGWIYFQRGEYAEAVTHLARAVQLSGGDVVILEHYADALVQAGDEAKALEIYRSALEKERDTDDREQEEIQERIERKLNELAVRRPDLVTDKR